MERRYYNASSIERTLRVFEQKYGMTSEDFYAAHLVDDDLHLPRSHRQSWAMFCRTWMRMTGGGFAAQAARELIA